MTAKSRNMRRKGPKIYANYQKGPCFSGIGVSGPMILPREVLMRYHSTRSMNETVSSARAVLKGLAPDGGLYMPQSLPTFDWQDCLKGSTRDMAEKILSAFLGDIPNMPELVDRAYTGKFSHPDLTPTVPVGKFGVLELFHGPTSAFKDVALSMLPQLLTAAREAEGQQEEILILTATSGDTGKAALVGFRDVPGISICVFYPDGGVSPVQKAQMTTQEGSNVAVCAVKGNFDDAQTGVKQIFSARRSVPAGELSSANSINIGRLVPQITYYFRAYRDLLDRGTIALGDEVNFSVPTGNFGDILAGYLAKLLGLPVGKLICASNANNVLTDFLRTGTYDRLRPLHKTISPSMDILVSSNLERLLYLLTMDTAYVAELMDRLSKEGRYTVTEELLAALQKHFWAGCCDDEGAKATIGKVWAEEGYLCDPHTATGWAVAEDYVNQTGDNRPMVVLSTASPYKFPAPVLTAIGGDLRGDEFDQMNRLEAITGVKMPENLRGLKEKAVLHETVIEKTAMPAYVESLKF